jgi:hypothetical protein
MAGKLEFTLGLVTGGFLSKIGGAADKLKGFIGGMISLGAITEGVMHAIETGAGLEHLHKRTGESVEDLVKLQGGFRAAGLEANDVGPALFHLQKALGGVNEFGQGTASTFNRMGLSIRTLKAMGAPQAMAAILGSLKGMNQSDAVEAASVIFGRGEAGNMLQLARSSGEFGEGMAKAAAKAAIFKDNASSFAHLEITLGQIKDKATTLWAGIAAGLAPAIQNVEDMLNDIDVSGIGTSIGRFFTALTQAFREGTLSNLISETFVVGLEGAVAFAPAILARLGYILLKTFEVPLTYFQAGLDYAVDKAVEKFAKARSKLGLNSINDGDAGTRAALLSRIEEQHKSGKLSAAEYAKRKAEASTGVAYKADSQKDILAERSKKGVEFFQQGYGFKEMDQGASQMMAEAKKKMAEASKHWLETINGLASRAPKGHKSEDIKKGGGQNLQSNYKPEFTQLEKMGFVMSGVGTADFARRTADATERIAAGIETFLNGPGDTEPVHEMSG